MRPRELWCWTVDNLTPFILLVGLLVYVLTGGGDGHVGCALHVDSRPSTAPVTR